MTKDDIVTDNRRSARFPMDAVVMISDTSNGKIYSGLCCNVSADGLLVSCEDDLPENVLLRLEITEEGCIYIADGHVVRKARGNNIFLIGLRVNFKLLPDPLES